MRFTLYIIYPYTNIEPPKKNLNLHGASSSSILNIPTTNTSTNEFVAFSFPQRPFSLVGERSGSSERERRNQELFKILVNCILHLLFNVLPSANKILTHLFLFNVLRKLIKFSRSNGAAVSCTIQQRIQVHQLLCLGGILHHSLKPFSQAVFKVRKNSLQQDWKLSILNSYFIDLFLLEFEYVKKIEFKFWSLND